MNHYKFSPSLMCMDLTSFREQVEFFNNYAYSYHVDIMDGHFVKNITLSPYFIEQLKKITNIPIDAHLMVENPGDFIDQVIDAGADIISLHAETINGEAFRLINDIKLKGKQFGVVLNPETSLDLIMYYIHKVDKITIMTVDPGFAGQKFIPEMREKIREIRDIKLANNYEFTITIDGSCNKKTYRVLAEAGAEEFILGSSGLFNLDKDIGKAWNKMREQFHKEVFTEKI
ncbi:D-allulose 6-phosphate 3-epimerase [Caldifermentibacillus hisashii]|uniref:D-allulose 6-phosphate 3-epimerase n=1 Tax=Caldifermentibacillus hisashii TaxID=996558 RepID=UPI0030E893AA